MNASFKEHWDAARKAEGAGDWATAEAAYRRCIAADGTRAAPMLRLSRFAQWRDDHREASAQAHAAKRVLAQGNDVGNAAHVSQRLLELSDYADAVALIEALDWNAVDVLRQSPTLIQHLWLAGDYAAAWKRLEAVQPRIQPTAAWHYLRGQVERSLGQLDAAAQSYAAALALRPDDAEIYWALTQHGRSRTPQQDADVLSRMLQSTRGQDAMAAVYLGYALSRRLEEADRDEEAWSSLCAASERMRLRVRHDADEERTRFAALMTHDWKLRPESPSADQSSPLFIVGLPRTGTTVLERMMGGHSRVESAGERNDIDAALSDVSGRFHRGGLHVEGLSQLDGLSLADVAARYRARIGPPPPGVQYVIDKNPQNLYNVGWILRALPQARILCVRRDPMDTLHSCHRALFEGGAYPWSYDLDALAAHVEDAHRLMLHWQDIAPNAVRIVDYETMVADPDGAARALAQFCGLVYESHMADIVANVSPVNTASSSQVREPIHQRGVGAWKRYRGQLTPWARRLGVAVDAADAT